MLEIFIEICVENPIFFNVHFTLSTALQSYNKIGFFQPNSAGVLGQPWMYKYYEMVCS
jgi:hypothetical protein